VCLIGESAKIFDIFRQPANDRPNQSFGKFDFSGRYGVRNGEERSMTDAILQTILTILAIAAMLLFVQRRRRRMAGRC
jgi:hypothetical protein